MEKVEQEVYVRCHPSGGEQEYRGAHTCLTLPRPVLGTAVGTGCGGFFWKIRSTAVTPLVGRWPGCGFNAQEHRLTAPLRKREAQGPRGQSKRAQTLARPLAQASEGT